MTPTDADRKAAADYLCCDGPDDLSFDGLQLAEAFASHAEAARREEREKHEVEIADLKLSVVAFCGPWAVQYAEQMGLPPGHLHAHLYDLLERCGARMVDFTRATAIEQGAHHE